MDERKNTRLHECHSVDDFLKRLQPPRHLDAVGITPTVLYRGVSDSQYELIPNALRTDGDSQRLSAEIKSLEKDRRYIVDVSVLRLFYQEANRHGLTLPYVDQDIHEALSQGKLNPNVNGAMFNRLLPVFGLAQHYGLPTRLLDWSFDPLVATYFAANGACRRLTKSSREIVSDSRLAVWYLQHENIRDIADLHVVHPPYGGNPNLSAQKGAFTFINIHDSTPLNESYKSTASSDLSDFHLVTLPLSQGPELLLEMRIRGYDAGRIFPGYGGAAQAVKELAMLKQLQ